MVAKKYPYRKKETYRGQVIDVKADTKEELGIKYAAKRNAIDKGMKLVGGAVTLNQFVDDTYWDKYVEDKVSDGVLADRKSIYRVRIRPVIGAYRVRDINSGHCQSVVNSLSGKYGRDAINKTCQLLYNIFRAAKRESMIYDNPADDILKPPASDGHGRPLTLQERALILSADHRASLWIQSILYLGIRPGETDILKSRHINYSEKLVFIDGTKSVSAKRIVPCPQFLLDQFGDLNRSSDEYIFINAHGDRMRKQSRAVLWRSFIAELEEMAGEAMADDLVPYCCRHSFATDLKDANIPYRIRQELLGHSDGSVTDRYTHRTEASLSTARDLLDKFRADQEIKIRKVQDQIMAEGYANISDYSVDLLHKYFPDA